MGLTLITPPATGVVTTIRMQTHLRLEQDAADYVQPFMEFAEAYAERKRGEQFITATYRLDVTAPTPADCRIREVYGFAEDVTGYIILPRPPLQTVSLVRYYDASGSIQTLSSGYRVVSGKSPAMVVFDATLPALAKREDALQITFTTGYGTAAQVPDHIRQAILLLAADAYRNREAGTEGDYTAVDRLLAIDPVRTP